MRATLRSCLRAAPSVLLVLALAGPLPAAEVHYAAHPVHGSWLVEVDDSVHPGGPMANLAHALAASRGGQVGSLYDGGFRGFVLRVPDQAIQGLSHHPLIKHLIQDEWYSEGVLSEAAPYCYGPEQMSNGRPLPSVNPATAQVIDCTEPEEGSGGPLCIDNWPRYPRGGDRGRTDVWGGQVGDDLPSSGCRQRREQRTLVDHGRLPGNRRPPEGEPDGGDRGHELERWQ